jgi:hypothetical protein
MGRRVGEVCGQMDKHLNVFALASMFSLAYVFSHALPNHEPGTGRRRQPLSLLGSVCRQLKSQIRL